MLKGASLGAKTFSCPFRGFGPSVRLNKVALAYEQGVEVADRPLQVSRRSSRYSVTLKKPLGLILEQDQSTNKIFVATVTREGSAAKDGRVSVNDVLLSTSGVTYTREVLYGETKVQQGQQVVRLSAKEESFTTISAAIRSHPGYMPVTLEFERATEP